MKDKKQSLGTNPAKNAARKRYDKPRVLSAELLEAVAAICENDDEFGLIAKADGVFDCTTNQS